MYNEVLTLNDLLMFPFPPKHSILRKTVLFNYSKTVEEGSLDSFGLECNYHMTSVLWLTLFHDFKIKI